jgi:wobble nucleotide-excising tRNase
MIESLEIAHVATYTEPQTMDRLKDVNFVFGTNGAGKTTIGRVVANMLAHPKCKIAWRDGLAMQPLVYNRDFVEANFTPADHLKGIFTLGEKDIANEMAIAAKRAEVERHVQDGTQFARTLGDAALNVGMAGELAALELLFKDQCWARKREHDQAFAEAFAGVRNDAVRFKDRVLTQAQSNAADSKPLEYLADRARTVFGEAPQRQAKVPSLAYAGIVELESSPILAKKVVGKDDVDIAEMIHRLGHSDWVKAGQALYEESAPNCPFCQQAAPEGLKASLEDYFDETFERDTKAIADLEAKFSRESATLLAALQSVAEADSKFLEKAAFARERATIEATLKANALVLTNKRKEPSAPQTLEPLADPLKAATELIDAANAAAVEHNAIVDGLGAEKTKLAAQVWRFILDDMKLDLDAYGAKKKALSAAITNLQRQILAAEQAKIKAGGELRQLEKAATTVQPTVDAINDLLQSFGFKTFALAQAAGEPRYKLVRHDGTDARHSLSEGEKSFVTFLYFYHLIKGSDSESGAALNRIVVFDDPVSSMDSDVLFIVSSLIRALFEDMRHGRGYVKQVFVLTHNVYFHKEVCYAAPQTKKGGAKGGKGAERKLDRSYWVVRKSAAGPRLERHDENPIKTSYELLWDEIRKGEKNPLTIQNTMRRILEHYFKILGGVDFDELCEKFEGRDKVVCRSLLSWVNDGSHFSHDDVHFAFGQEAIDDQLVIFAKIFERAEHSAHYDMMMDKK